MNQQAWERAIGMRGYSGSPAEREDRSAGIKVGGKVQWGIPGDAVLSTIKKIAIDEQGDPRFTLTIDDGDYQSYLRSKGREDVRNECHKDITVDREEIFPLGF